MGGRAGTGGGGTVTHTTLRHVTVSVSNKCKKVSSLHDVLLPLPDHCSRPEAVCTIMATLGK